MAKIADFSPVTGRRRCVQILWSDGGGVIYGYSAGYWYGDRSGGGRGNGYEHSLEVSRGDGGWMYTHKSFRRNEETAGRGDGSGYGYGDGAGNGNGTSC